MTLLWRHYFRLLWHCCDVIISGCCETLPIIQFCSDITVFKGLWRHKFRLLWRHCISGCCDVTILEIFDILGEKPDPSLPKPSKGENFCFIICSFLKCFLWFWIEHFLFYFYTSYAFISLMTICIMKTTKTTTIMSKHQHQFQRHRQKNLPPCGAVRGQKNFITKFNARLRHFRFMTTITTTS